MFVQEQGSLSVLRRIGKRGSIAIQVADLTSKLNSMMQMFQVSIPFHRAIRTLNPFVCCETTSSLNIRFGLIEMAKDLAIVKTIANQERKYHDGEQVRLLYIHHFTTLTH